MAEECRRLDISDFKTEQEAEIIKNPYKFLFLPIDAPADQVRRSYIQLAKLYHPDMINPYLQSETLGNLFSAGDFKGQKSKLSFDEIKKYMDEVVKDAEKMGEILKDIRTAAHRKMVLLNRAYQEIKSRYLPKEWNQLFGYDFKDVEGDEIGSYKTVDLEGRGELDIYPNNHDYWVSGPHLFFDWGPPIDHEWYPEEYRHCINLRHMFAYLDMQEGKEVNPFLIKPFLDCFKIGEGKSKQFLDLLNKKRSTEEIMNELHIPDEPNPNDNHIRLCKLRFQRQLNEITTLSRSPKVYHYEEPPFKITILDGDKLRLEDYTQSNFSETDYLLFVTLAYGPLLC